LNCAKQDTGYHVFVITLERNKVAGTTAQDRTLPYGESMEDSARIKELKSESGVMFLS